MQGDLENLYRIIRTSTMTILITYVRAKPEMCLVDEEYLIVNL